MKPERVNATWESTAMIRLVPQLDESSGGTPELSLHLQCPHGPQYWALLRGE